MKTYRHTIHFVNGKAITIDTDTELLEFSLFSGFVFLQLSDENTVTQILMNSVLFITNKEI